MKSTGDFCLFLVYLPNPKLFWLHWLNWQFWVAPPASPLNPVNPVNPPPTPPGQPNPRNPPKLFWYPWLYRAFCSWAEGLQVTVKMETVRRRREALVIILSSSLLFRWSEDTEECNLDHKISQLPLGSNWYLPWDLNMIIYIKTDGLMTVNLDRSHNYCKEYWIFNSMQSRET